MSRNTDVEQILTAELAVSQVRQGALLAFPESFFRGANSQEIQHPAEFVPGVGKIGVVVGDNAVFSASDFQDALIVSGPQVEAFLHGGIATATQRECNLERV